MTECSHNGLQQRRTEASNDATNNFGSSSESSSTRLFQGSPLLPVVSPLLAGTTPPPTAGASVAAHSLPIMNRHKGSHHHGGVSRVLGRNSLKRVLLLAVMTVCMVVLTTTKAVHRAQCKADPRLCGSMAVVHPVSPRNTEAAPTRRGSPTHGFQIEFSELKKNGTEPNSNVMNDDDRSQEPVHATIAEDDRGHNQVTTDATDVIAEGAAASPLPTTGSESSSAAQDDEKEVVRGRGDTGGRGRHSRNERAGTTRRPSRSPKDKTLISPRWPSLPVGDQSMRRKRRFHHSPATMATPLSLNAGWGCPDHRARSPTGFLPSGRMHPVDSVTAVVERPRWLQFVDSGGRKKNTLQALRVWEDAAFAEALISRDDIDSSPYFRYISPSPATSTTLQRDSVLPNHEENVAPPLLLEMRECGAVTDEAVVGHQASAPPLLQVDIVYTYVNGTSPSFRDALRMRNISYDPHRYHDWDELRYSLRSIYLRAICARDPPAPRRTNTNEREDSQPPPRIECEEGTFVRMIYIVVADKDQVPTWLDVSHPKIRIVEHRDIFPTNFSMHTTRAQQKRQRRMDGRRTRLGGEGEEGEGEAPGGGGMPYLPTFNSHAIELHLHRIPGLQRFFIYLNNDMLFGRRVSLLDYFRPLSSHRHALRERYGAMLDVVHDNGALAKQNDSDLGSGGCDASTAQLAYGMFEPIIYGESEAHSCVPRRRKGAAAKLRKALRDDEAEIRRRLANNVSLAAAADGRCLSHPLRPSALFDIECFYPTRGLSVDPMLQKAHFNHKMAFERLDGVAAVHTYPHFPQMFDRLLLERMIEVDFHDAAEETRRSPVRTERDLWVTLLYSTYALAHRLAVETRLEMKSFASRSQQAGVAHEKKPPAARRRNTAPLLLPLVEPADYERCAMATLMDHASLDQPLSDDSTRALLNLLGRNYFSTDTWLPQDHWQFLFTPTATTTTEGGTATSTLSPRWSAFINRTRRFDMSWMGPDALLACSKRLSCTSVAREKLYHHIVFLFNKMSSYRFCMLKNRRTAVACLKDVYWSSSGNATRLFWTLNDDWKFNRRPTVSIAERRKRRTRLARPLGDRETNITTRQLLQLTSRDEGDDAAHRSAESRRKKHRELWDALKRRSRERLQSAARPVSENDNDLDTKAATRRTRNNDEHQLRPNELPRGAGGDNPRRLRDKRNARSFPSRFVSTHEAAALTRAIMKGITREVGMAPWELWFGPAVPHHSAERQLGDDVQEAEEDIPASLQLAYGPTELTDIRSRHDVSSFLREEWRRDQIQHKDDWLRNPLNL